MSTLWQRTGQRIAPLLVFAQWLNYRVVLGSLLHMPSEPISWITLLHQVWCALCIWKGLSQGLPIGSALSWRSSGMPLYFTITPEVSIHVTMALKVPYRSILTVEPEESYLVPGCPSGLASLQAHSNLTEISRYSVLLLSHMELSPV